MNSELAGVVPIYMSVSVQQFEDGLAVHVWRNIEPGDVQNSGGQVDVQHNVRVARKKS